MNSGSGDHVSCLMLPLSRVSSARTSGQLRASQKGSTEPHDAISYSHWAFANQNLRAKKTKKNIFVFAVRSPFDSKLHAFLHRHAERTERLRIVRKLCRSSIRAVLTLGAAARSAMAVTSDAERVCGDSYEN